MLALKFESVPYSIHVRYVGPCTKALEWSLVGPNGEVLSPFTHVMETQELFSGLIRYLRYILTLEEDGHQLPIFGVIRKWLKYQSLQKSIIELELSARTITALNNPKQQKLMGLPEDEIVIATLWHLAQDPARLEAIRGIGPVTMSEIATALERLDLPHCIPLNL